MHHPEQVLEASRGGHQGDLLRDAAEGDVELLFNNGHAGELAQRFDISGRQGEGGFEFFLRLRGLSLGSEPDAHQIEPARVLGAEGLELAERFGRPGRLTLGQVGQAEEDMGLENARLPSQETLQVLDGGLDRALLNIQLGQQKHGLGEVGSGRYRFLQLSLGLLEVPDLDLSNPKLVARHGIPGIELQDLLEFLDRLGVLLLGQVHAP